MGFLDNLNKLLSLFRFGFRAFARPLIFLPFILYLLVQVILLLALNSYTSPYIYSILSPVVELFGAERAEVFSHYPGLYLLLPFVFQIMKLVPGILFEGLAIGLTVILFIKYYGRDRQYKLSLAFGNWFNLALSWTIITGILFAISWYAPQIFESYLYGSPRRVMFFNIILRFVIVLFYCPFIYAVPLIIIKKYSFIKALGKSIVYFFRLPIFSFFFALTAYLFTVPASLLSEQSGLIVSKFSPELVLYVLLLTVFVDLIINVVFTGAISKFLLEEED